MKWIVGIDEVGRGALAGPVVVTAALVPEKKSIFINKKFGALRDSKKLTQKQREVWCAHFKTHTQVRYVTARVYPRRIETINISAAANLAALRAFTRLSRKHRLPANTKIFLDGGLFLGSGPQPKNAKTIIRGDEKIPAVAAASIIAKVSRDRTMTRLGKKHPHYGFAIHKGYGTALHRRAIRKYGPIDVHRKTFLSKIKK